MGDRCYLEITYRKDDHPAFQKILGWKDSMKWYDDVLEQNDTWIHVYADEVNYGLMSEREAIAQDGIPFFGWHGAGGDYECCLFAAADGEMADVVGTEERPRVGLREDGSIDPSEVNWGMAYYRILHEAKDKVYMKITGFYTASPDYKSA